MEDEKIDITKLKLGLTNQDIIDGTITVYIEEQEKKEENESIHTKN